MPQSRAFRYGRPQKINPRTETTGCCRSVPDPIGSTLPRCLGETEGLFHIDRGGSDVGPVYRVACGRPRCTGGVTGTPQALAPRVILAVGTGVRGRYLRGRAGMHGARWTVRGTCQEWRFGMRWLLIGVMVGSLWGCGARSAVSTLPADVAALEAEVRELQRQLEEQQAQIQALHGLVAHPTTPEAPSTGEPEWSVRQAPTGPIFEADWSSIPSAWIMRQCRAIPHKAAAGTDEVDGLRLSGIRKGRVLDQLGFRSGDIIHTVNGRPVASMEAMSELHHQLAQVDRPIRLEVTLSRSKQPVTMQLLLVDTAAAGQDGSISAPD